MKQILFNAGRGVGALVCSVTSLLWLYALYTPNEAFALTSWTILVSVLLTLASIMGAIASVHGHGNVMLAVFLVSFLPVGAYLIRTDHWLSWIGICNVVLLAAALATRWSRPDPGDKREVEEA